MAAPRVAVVVLARAGSSRLPGKMLEPFGPGSVLTSSLRRCLALERADEIILATTTSPGDDALALEAAALGLRVVRGSEHDVVARMVQALDELELPCDVVVRACADNPLFMPSLVDAAVDELRESGCDLLTPFEYATLPFGYGLVVMTSACLRRIHRDAGEPAYREHVENYCLEHPEQFHVRYQLAPPGMAWPELCLTLDYAVDLLRLRRLASVLEDVAVADQPRVLIDHLRNARVWIEGRDTGSPEEHDLVLLAAERPGLQAPRGVLVVDRFDVGGRPRYGLRYAAECPPGFPLGAVILDELPGAKGTALEFLERVAELAPAHLLAAPARPIDLVEFAAPPLEKRVRAEHRRGFQSAGEEAFPARVLLEHADHPTELLEALLCELEDHTDTELFLDQTDPAELARAIARLGAERVHAGRPAADAFRVLVVSGPDQLEIPGARGPLGGSSLAAFWRSTSARAARAQLLNEEALR